MAQGTARGYHEKADAIQNVPTAAIGGLAVHTLSEQGSDRLCFAAAGPGADHVPVCRPLRGAEERTLCQGWAHTLQECMPASECQLPGGGDQVFFEDRHEQGGGGPVQSCGGEFVFSTYSLSVMPRAAHFGNHPGRNKCLSIRHCASCLALSCPYSG